MNQNTFPTEDELDDMKTHEAMKIVDGGPSTWILDDFEDKFESLRSKYNMSRKALEDLIL